MRALSSFQVTLGAGGVRLSEAFPIYSRLLSLFPLCFFFVPSCSIIRSPRYSCIPKLYLTFELAMKHYARAELRERPVPCFIPMMNPSILMS